MEAGIQTGPARGEKSGEQQGLSLSKRERCRKGNNQGQLGTSSCSVLVCEKRAAESGIAWGSGLVFGKSSPGQ